MQHDDIDVLCMNCWSVNEVSTSQLLFLGTSETISKDRLFQKTISVDKEKSKKRSSPGRLELPTS